MPLTRVQNAGVQPSQPLRGHLEDINVRNSHREVQRLDRRVITGQATTPGATDDTSELHDVGTIWIDELSDKAYVCLDNTAGAAIWAEISTSTSPIVATTGVLKYTEASSVSVSTLTTVATFTASADTSITNVLCSGQESGKWQIFIDTVLKMTQRTVDRNVQFDFDNPFLLANGSIIDVKVTHFVTGATPDFEAAILGFT